MNDFLVDIATKLHTAHSFRIHGILGMGNGLAVEPTPVEEPEGRVSHLLIEESSSRQPQVIPFSFYIPYITLE